MNRNAIPLPIGIIREALELDPVSPTWLRWKIRPRGHFNSNKGWRCFNTRDAGKVAGSEFANGCGNKYYQVGINGRFYYVHRIVYFLAYGIDPAGKYIDHKDGDGQNNNPDNLRLATRTENSRNRGTNRNNTSGIKGVYWNKEKGKWQARIQINRKHKHLGYFCAP